MNETNSSAASATTPCSRDSLPMDERRLKSVASDIARKWSKRVPEVEKQAMMWAIQEFHRWLVSENTPAHPQQVGCGDSSNDEQP